MLSVTPIDLPSPVLEELRARAAYPQSFLGYVQSSLASLEQPVALAAALVGPVLVAMAFLVGGTILMLKTAAIILSMALMLFLGAYLLRQDDLAWSYEQTAEIGDVARAALRSGRGDSVTLSLTAEPCFVAHPDGLIVIAKAADARAVYFDLENGYPDARWHLWTEDHPIQTEWQWIRPEGASAVLAFDTSGPVLPGPRDYHHTDAPDAWEAVSLALGEPMDGDLIDMPFEEARATVLRLL